MSIRTETHQDLLVWQKSMLLVESIYRLTKDFPKDEIYGLTSQMRRAVTAIPTNITEGYHRNHYKEYIQFLFIAKSSAWELKTLLQIADRVKLIHADAYIECELLLGEVIKMLTTMITQLKEKYNYKP